MISAKHKFTSLKGDGSDGTLLRPSNWNDEHSITLGANTLVGRISAGTGDAEEIPLTTYMAGLLNTADLAALAALLGLPTTGDFKLTIKATADAGWVMCNDGTISKLGAGGTARANDDCLALYTALYALPDAYAPVIGGRGGAGAAVDWGAGKAIALTKMLGRSLAIAGAGTGLSVRALGAFLGEEAHALTALENASHAHGVFIRDPGHAHTTNAATNVISNNWAQGGAGSGYTTATVHSNTTGIHANSVSGGTAATDDATALQGNGDPHNNMQPTSFLNVMVKL